jgi:DNA repair protein RecO (recombination protein O)
MCLSGYEPALGACDSCGLQEPFDPVFDCSGGVLLCKKCASDLECNAVPLCSSSLAAMRYALAAEDARLFSFTLKNESIARLTQAAEAFVETQLEKRFKTLDYYNKFL